MRLYEFKDKEGTIDTIVVTDGCNDQKNVFITETPRNVNDAILAMGFNFVVGTEVMHQDLVKFATDNELQLLVHHEGLQNEIEEVVALPEED